ncbi:hypothetical protein [Streptococcus pneumoniae]|uniref:hypothetical protein n=1 Tax=Streptococcus pneumoniae TaxID=1313 RepID=UPI0005E6147F|nr:hypothetical protein [Streptococcus pneumoniae]CMZ14478.1 chlorohydrolase [Streptococcus pneumoniae]
MKIKEQTRKLSTTSKHCFEVVDRTDEVSSKHELTKSAQNTVLRLWIELTESVSYTYGKVKLTWFEDIFEEYKKKSVP